MYPFEETLEDKPENIIDDIVPDDELDNILKQDDLQLDELQGTESGTAILDNDESIPDDSESVDVDQELNPETMPEDDNALESPFGILEGMQKIFSDIFAGDPSDTTDVNQSTVPEMASVVVPAGMIVTAGVAGAALFWNKRR